MKQMGVMQEVMKLQKKTIAALTKQVELLDKDGVSQAQVEFVVYKIQALKDLYQVIK
ncbi:hypothetical protein H9X86_08625 [Pseudoflavonifractor capillosus]|uniref:hypothetical protein n=1 Tax=Pseudoflavonifractor capillosus TaxID=106588 RepID=UPI00195882DD|nr:hypothetical protein [Pseudoflavonifractor capillosus]MBM6897427.1 hypothetical protein [Pseudoflavonifractor capillosus]